MSPQTFFQNKEMISEVFNINNKRLDELEKIMRDIYQKECIDFDVLNKIWNKVQDNDERLYLVFQLCYVNRRHIYSEMIKFIYHASGLHK